MKRAIYFLLGIVQIPFAVVGFVGALIWGGIFAGIQVAEHICQNWGRKW